MAKNVKNKKPEEKPESGIEKRLKNLRPPWKIGDPPGPGRPKGQRNYATLYREGLLRLAKENGKDIEEVENMLAAKGLSLAMKGNYNFYKDVMDRIHGTAIQKTEVGGVDGEPMVFVHFRDLEDYKAKDKKKKK